MTATNTFYWFPSFLTLAVHESRDELVNPPSGSHALDKEMLSGLQSECATSATGAGSTSALVSYWLPVESDTATRQSHGHKICSHVFTPRSNAERRANMQAVWLYFRHSFFLLLNVLYPLHPVGDFSQLERMAVGRGRSLRHADGEDVTISHCIHV